MTIGEKVDETDTGSVFAGFYRVQYRPVLAYAHVHTGVPALAEEITQEAFLAAHQQRDRITHPRAWIRKVVANKSRSVLRRRYSERRAVERLSNTTPTRTEMPQPTSEFWAAVRRLPGRQAEAIVLHYLEDRPVSEIASFLGCAESTARVHLTRGRRNLAKTIGATL